LEIENGNGNETLKSERESERENSERGY